jgi:hypothetical protein
MFASLIHDHPDSQSHRVRPLANNALVRMTGDVHEPAAGEWGVGAGQRLELASRGARTRAVSARVVGGTLRVGDDLLDSSLAFTMSVPGADTVVGFDTRLTHVVSVDSWQAEGSMTTIGEARPVTLHLRYNGVFRQRERQPSLWLTIRAIIDLPEIRGVVGSRRARGLHLAADLNLNPRT